MKFRSPRETLYVRAIVERLARGRSEAESARRAIECTDGCAREGSGCVLSRLGDDVDDAVYGVGSPNRPAWSPDDLDAIDILQQRVLHSPVDAGKERRVDAAAVNQHQQRLRELVGEP